MNTQSIMPIFYEQYCQIHIDQYLNLICLDEICQNYLNLQCSKCHHCQSPQDEQSSSQLKGYRKNSCTRHKHQHCRSLDNYLKQKLYPKVFKTITERIRQKINQLRKKVDQIFSKIIKNVQDDWYQCLELSCTKKQCVFILENPSKLSKIEQTALLKDQFISNQFQNLITKLQRESQKICHRISVDTTHLKYSQRPDKWKFDIQRCHTLLNISSNGRTVDKKSDVPKFCLCLANQPITPYKNQVTFTINSQNIYEKYMMLGLCNLEKATKFEYELSSISSAPSHIYSGPKNSQSHSLPLHPENNGLFAIYQASNYKASNNALSLHSGDSSMNYKQIVGWNFGSGDSVTIGYNYVNQAAQNVKTGQKKQIHTKGRVWFRKNEMKDKFQFEIDLSGGIIYPFVALYASGDKVTIQPN